MVNYKHTPPSPDDILVIRVYCTTSTGEQRSMSLFKAWTELRQESRYTRSKASGFNVSSAYVLKSDMDLCSPAPVNAVTVQS